MIPSLFTDGLGQTLGYIAIGGALMGIAWLISKINK